MGEITGLICAFRKGRAENAPSPPSAMSIIATTGATFSARVKALATGFVVPTSSAKAVFRSRSRASDTSVAMQHRVNQLMFSSASCRRVKSRRSCRVATL
ncbi:hypothetical protein KU6B_44060 [Mameliella alba]|nr:hypothetical protein KU6B_44060 [Mameliella alba]